MQLKDHVSLMATYNQLMNTNRLRLEYVSPAPVKPRTNPDLQRLITLTQVGQFLRSFRDE